MRRGSSADKVKSEPSESYGRRELRNGRTESGKMFRACARAAPQSAAPKGRNFHSFNGGISACEYVIGGASRAEPCLETPGNLSTLSSCHFSGACGRERLRRHASRCRSVPPAAACCKFLRSVWSRRHPEVAEFPRLSTATWQLYAVRIITAGGTIHTKWFILSLPGAKRC